MGARIFSTCRARRTALHRLSRGGYRSAEYEILKTALEHIERSQTVMFLASCSYMLTAGFTSYLSKPVKLSVLRSELARLLP